MPGQDRVRLRFRTSDRLHDSPVVANGMVYFPQGVGCTLWPPMPARSLGNTSSHSSGPNSGSGNSRCLGRPASPGANGASRRGNLSSAIVSAPAVAREAIYVGDTNGYFYGREALTGQEPWEFRADGAIMASPVIIGPKSILRCP